MQLGYAFNQYDKGRTKSILFFYKFQPQISNGFLPQSYSFIVPLQ